MLWLHLSLFDESLAYLQYFQNSQMQKQQRVVNVLLLTLHAVRSEFGECKYDGCIHYRKKNSIGKICCSCWFVVGNITEFQCILSWASVEDNICFNFLSRAFLAKHIYNEMCLLAKYWICCFKTNHIVVLQTQI